MKRQEVFEYVKEKYATEPDYPWSDDSAVLRCSNNRKWYGLVMQVGRNKLGLEGEGNVDALNVKCDPVFTGMLRIKPGFFPAYHMNKEHWITILLDHTVPDDEVKKCIDMSYELVRKK